ncbi:hypothetical protein [Bradyrhizobium uaiense]|uniref:hypothetical protein n=1 Tax=Bradyrhizobium uaiense TaxID=2594946 RepID=UPI0013EF5010|nr:hypothetical protein [Bradyrhizobium uaiense]
MTASSAARSRKRTTFRKEIAQRGAYWAGDEIWKLRRQVAALHKRIAELEEIDA